MDGALEAVEHVAVPRRDDLERKIIVVPAHLALGHLKPPFRVGACRKSWRARAG
jgi:hypothetical protein